MLKISRESEIGLINILIDHDIISGKDLSKIKKLSSEENKSQIDAVFELKLTDENKILDVLIKEQNLEIVDLSTGETVGTPLFPRSIQHKLWVMPTGMANHPGNVRGTDIAGDLLIRYCDAKTFDEDQARLMVIDDQFNEIWSVDSQPPGLGHTFSSQFFDVDGDGKDEVLASYQLLSSKGQTIWRMQDTINDIQNRAGAGHIDFAVIGNLAGDEELDPTIFVCSGGVYVVDGMTGNLRAAHHIGHTQGGKIGNFFSDLPGLECSRTHPMGKYGNCQLCQWSGKLAESDAS